MPRARVSCENQQLALEFANLVTTSKGTTDSSLMARRGPNSIYFVLSQCTPGVIRDRSANSNRRGITEAEFLRVLDDSGDFHRFRDRKAVKISDDPAGAGMCMFKNVRWRNPGDPADMDYLRDQHTRLVQKFDVCNPSLHRLVSILTAIIVAWNGRSTIPLRSAVPGDGWSAASGALVASAPSDSPCPVLSPHTAHSQEETSRAEESDNEPSSRPAISGLQYLADAAINALSIESRSATGPLLLSMCDSERDRLRLPPLSGNKRPHDLGPGRYDAWARCPSSNGSSSSRASTKVCDADDPEIFEEKLRQRRGETQIASSSHLHFTTGSLSAFSPADVASGNHIIRNSTWVNPPAGWVEQCVP